MVLRRGGRKIHDIFLKINQSAKVRTFNRVETLNLFVMGTKAYSNSDVVLTAPAQKHLSPEENTIRKRLKQGKGTWCCGIFFFLTNLIVIFTSQFSHALSTMRVSSVYPTVPHRVVPCRIAQVGSNRPVHPRREAEYAHRKQCSAHRTVTNTSRDGEQWSEWGGDFVSTV